MHTLEDKDNHFKHIVLFPSYASSGIWCECGLGLGDPINTLDVPSGLIELVDLWNSYWDRCSSNKKYVNVEYVEREIINTGRYLTELISTFVPCELLEERCKLDLR